MVSATNSFGLKVRDFGTPEQKERFLRPVASGREIACLALTEPHAGSDMANLRSRAVRHGNGYLISGTKNFITSGRSSSVAVVLAVTDPGAGKRGISAFLVRTDQPGYRVVRVEQKLGHRSNDTCQILLENLEVPGDDMLGPPGQGLKIALSGLDSGRIGVAARSVGVARAAFDAALRYARSVRQEADGPPGDRLPAAEMATDIEVARQMDLRAATLKEARARCIKEASMSKLFASQMCERVCSAAIQIHGGYGYINEIGRAHV